MTTRKAERYVLPGNAPTDEDLRHEADLTRAELGDTAAELLRRMDVGSRMREAAAQRRVALLHDTVDATLDTARRHRVVVIGGAVTMLALVVLLKVRR